jgi:hypothetical protein
MRIGWSVDPSRVIPLGGIVHVGVVVELANFVPEVDERYTASRHDDRVGEEYSLYSTRFSGFESSERGSRSGYPTIASLWIVLEGYPSGERAGMTCDEKGIEETTVVQAILAELKSVLVGKSP